MRMSDWSSDVCSSDLWPSTSSTFFLQALVGVYKKKVEEVLGHPFPQDVNDQLWGAVGAVFGSWQSERAKVYRRINDISDAWGTAVRSEEHTSELQSLMRIPYAVFCSKKKRSSANTLTTNKHQPPHPCT